MIVQASGVAAIGNGVEVEVEGFRLREQQRRQFADPGGQEFLLVGALGTVGVIGDEGFLGQDVEAGKEPKSLVEVEVVDVAAAFFVEEFQDQEAKQSPGGGNHFRAGIAGIIDEAVKAELGEQRQEQENAGDARAQGTIIGQRQRAAIGDGWDFGTRCGVVGADAAR